MHNTYISSTVFSLGAKGSLSFSFNDYSNLLNQRFDRTPLSQSPCCSCCSCCCCEYATQRLPISSSSLYGLRQSNLIQWSSSRRMILGGRDRYLFRVPVYEPSNCYYEVSCSLKERSGHGTVGRRKGNFRCMVSEDKSERYQFGGVEDVEAVISLLSEEVGGECLCGRERDRRSSKRVEVKKTGNYGRECSSEEKKRVKVERRASYGSQSNRARKKIVESNFLESDSKQGFGLERTDSRQKEYERTNERDTFTRVDNHRRRKKSSSCSSYYSFSSSMDLENDTEVQDDAQLVEGLSGAYKESRKNEGGRFERQDTVELKRQNDVEKHEEVSGQIHTAAGSGVEWDCRKKSEKKLTMEEMNTTRESSQVLSKKGKTIESGYRQSSCSHKHFGDEEERLAVGVNLEKRTMKEYNEIDSQVIGQCEAVRNYKENMHMLKIQSQGEEENLMISGESVYKNRDELHKRVGPIGKHDTMRNSQRQAEMSGIQDVEVDRISQLQRQSESRMKIWEEDRSSVPSPPVSAKEQCLQTGLRITEQNDSRTKSEHLCESSEIRTKNHEGYSGLARERCSRSQTDQKPSRDMDSQRTSQTGVREQVSTVTSFVKPLGETRERYNQTAEIVMQTKSGKDVQKSMGQSFHQEIALEETSSSRSHLDSASRMRMQHIDLEEASTRDSQGILMPPPSQMVTRGSGHVDRISGIYIQENSGETSESGYIHTESGQRMPLLHDQHGRDVRRETYDQLFRLTTPDDAMGSAHRLEESSTQFVGEFIEKARQEVFTSEIQKKEKVSETLVVYEGEKHEQESVLEHGSEGVQQKGHDSTRSSGGSGAKGPSDEMWDVTDPTVQEPPETEAPQGSTDARTAITKRSGRSLWSIIADVVRLRWVSRAETPRSAARSGGKSSSNESASSETWFSGREPDENSDENTKERRSKPQVPTSFRHLHLGQTLSQSRGETSEVVVLKDKVRKLDAETTSSGLVDSGSASPGVFPTSGKENLGADKNQRSFQRTSYGMEGGSSTVPVPSRSLRRSPAVKETDPGQIDTHISDSTEQIEQPENLNLTEVSESQVKDGELKQRKLQRNKQVLRDRFDDWEEAYKLETEQRKIDEMFMREALLEAQKAADTWEVPVGAVLVQHGKIVARGCNLVEELRDSTAHAEMICIREASNQLRTWRLADTTLYVTLEPCAMCAGAILQARITTLVWGAPNKLLGADGSWVRLFPNGGGSGSDITDKPTAPIHPFHPKMTIRRGVLSSECADIMQQFFQLRRKKKDKDEDLPPQPACLPISTNPSKVLSKMHDIFHVMFCL